MASQLYQPGTQIARFTADVFKQDRFSSYKAVYHSQYTAPPEGCQGTGSSPFGTVNSGPKWQQKTFKNGL